MDVRCERCSTVYDFDEARIPVEGLAVKCSTCGHVFRAFRSVAPHAGADDQWMVRQANGNVVRFKEMTTLQRWIVERKVTRDDQISKTGKAWKHLGEIAELTPFFQAVEQPVLAPTPLAAAPSAGARWEASPQALPQMQSGAWQIGAAPAAPAPAFIAQPMPAPTPEDDDFEPQTGGKAKWVLFVLLVLVAGGAGGAYVLRPQLFARLLGRGVDELAVQQVENGYTELKKDSYGAIERARGIFEKAVALDPTYVEGKAGLAQAELARAEDVGEEADELATKLASAPVADQPAMKAEVDKRRREVMERSDRAFAAAKEALSSDPESVAANRAMADYYRIMKTPDTMKPLIDRARQKAPTDPWVAYVLGASVAPDPTLAERAIRYFDEALEAAPDLVRARYRMARVFWAQGNAHKALMHVETILKAVPDHELALALQNEIKPPPVQTPPPPEAPAAPPPPAEKALTFDQLVARAERLRNNEQVEKALALYEKASEMVDDDPDVYTGMGWCYVDMEEADAAVASFNRALRLVPRFSDAHLGIAEAYRIKGMKRDAIKHYREYLDILPDGPEAPVAKRMIEQLQ